MLKWLAVLILVSAPCLAEESEWKRPTVLEAVPMALTVGFIWADVLQTRDGLRTTDPLRHREETNFFLGRNPSDPKLFLLGGVVPTLVLTAVWYFLPSPQRSLFIIGPTIAMGETVWENADKGLVIHF